MSMPEDHNSDAIDAYREDPSPHSEIAPISAIPPQVLTYDDSAPVTQVPPEPLVIAPTTTRDISEDIQSILKGVGLPERRDTEGIADKPKPQISSAPEPLKEAAAAPSLPAQASPVVPLHTLKDDINDVIRINKISLVKAAAMEQDRRSDSDEPRVRVRRRGSWGLIFAILFFVILGGMALAGVFYVENSRHASVDIPADDSLVFAEQTVSINIANTNPLALKTQISNWRNKQALAVGSIMRIKPINEDDAHPELSQPATAAEFMKALGTHAPDDLMRALGDTFFFGIHTTDKNTPILLFTVNSYDRAFAAMLEWESTMNGDLAPIFTAVPLMTRNATGTPQQRVFSDEVMRNYDVRVLKDDSGNIVMYYSFPNPRILIIAESPYSFVEILSRLQAQRAL